jgi:hypothetical protein
MDSVAPVAREGRARASGAPRSLRRLFSADSILRVPRLGPLNVHAATGDDVKPHP